MIVGYGIARSLDPGQAVPTVKSQAWLFQRENFLSYKSMCSPIALSPATPWRLYWMGAVLAQSKCRPWRARLISQKLHSFFPATPLQKRLAAFAYAFLQFRKNYLSPAIPRSAPLLFYE